MGLFPMGFVTGSIGLEESHFGVGAWSFQMTFPNGKISCPYFARLFCFKKGIGCGQAYFAVLLDSFASACELEKAGIDT